MSGMNERQRIDNSRRVLHWYDFLCPFWPRRRGADIEAAIDQISRQPNGGLIFPSDTFTGIRSEGIIKLARIAHERSWRPSRK
jgi:hypothetical protein